MKIYILGLGETINQYKHHNNNISFGVNDIESYINTPVDHLVVVNTIGCFTTPRQKVIKESKPRIGFYTIKYDTNEFETYHKNLVYLDYKTGTALSNCYDNKGNVRKNIALEDGKIYAALSSPFMAVQLAFKLYPQVKEMHIFGVDYLNHWAFEGHRLDKELKYWKWLFTQLTNKGIKIILPIESKLNDVL